MSNTTLLPPFLFLLTKEIKVQEYDLAFP
jgi:hypothetical protein